MTTPAHRHSFSIFSAIMLLFTLLLPASHGLSFASTNKDEFKALYFPPHKITHRSVDEVIHYVNISPVNAVVLHVKTPEGKLMWPSKNTLATRLGVSSTHSGLARQVARLNNHGIHTIAKLDVFADHRLSESLPDLAVIDELSGLPWSDANNLGWSNPTNRHVWEYNIALAKELSAIGFAEIQFDYVRFPSDGDLSRIRYPNAAPGFSKSDTIAAFLALAHSELKPLGVRLSADIFGLTAWKTGDFGVGQVLEKMAPHLDVICPMFYPSHFPSGFLGKQSPGDFPEMIMQASMRSIIRRTDKPIRPWIQGFWYTSQEIGAQISGIEKAVGQGWSIWSPAGRYEVSYQALSQRYGIDLAKPQFYPTLNELSDKNDRFTKGNRIVVNYTSYRQGYSIISLEAPGNGKRSLYGSPAAVLSTIDEGIIDHILRSRSVRFNPNTEPHVKRALLSNLLCNDLEKDARRIRPEPIYINWGDDCIFSTEDIPELVMDRYIAASREDTREKMAALSSGDAINIASVSKSIFGVVVDETTKQPYTVLSR